MSQEEYSNNCDYYSPTFHFYNLEQGQFVLNKLCNSNFNINLVYPYNNLIWSGTGYLEKIFRELKNNRLKVFADCRDNIEFALSLLRSDIDNIIFNSKNQKVNKKIIDLAGKYDCKIFLKNKFKKFFLINRTNGIEDFKKQFEIYEKKINL